jgi:hypothetical protein
MFVTQPHLFRHHITCLSHSPTCSNIMLYVCHTAPLAQTLGELGEVYLWSHTLLHMSHSVYIFVEHQVTSCYISVTHQVTYLSHIMKRVYHTTRLHICHTACYMFITHQVTYLSHSMLHICHPPGYIFLTQHVTYLSHIMKPICHTACNIFVTHYETYLSHSRYTAGRSFCVPYLLD